MQMLKNNRFDRRHMQISVLVTALVNLDNAVPEAQSHGVQLQNVDSACAVDQTSFIKYMDTQCQSHRGHFSYQINQRSAQMLLIFCVQCAIILLCMWVCV